MNKEALEKEVEYKHSRSSGPGGQHVNKVNTSVELRFDIQNTTLLSEEQKQKIFNKLKGKINNDGILIITSQESRSQIKNKQIALDKCHDLITKALKPGKRRKPTNRPKAAEEKRLSDKKVQSEKKSRRKGPAMD